MKSKTFPSNLFRGLTMSPLRKMGGRITIMVSLITAICGSMSPLVAQIPSTLFEDDFSANTIDPAKYQADAPFFEGGVGDIHAQATNGVIEFVGSTTQQWWSGGTLRVQPVFTASEQSAVSVSIDRVAEAGVGTASRSALWILDETKTKYVLFADVRGEGGWHYNRKIGEDGDAPTGGGTDIAAFNGDTFDDGGLHRMQMVADGKTVKLYLDGQFGVEVKFPFSKIVVEFGSYARANADTADTTFDNLRVEALRQSKVLLQDDFASDTIDAGRYQPDAPFFEGGVGDIHAQAGNGVIEFVGNTTQQWWSGGTLRVTQTYSATEQTTVMASIDRVAEAGVGTASRSALWILDETRTKYVLFADVRAEGGWRYNRKIGEDGDVPTGSGTDIALFNGADYDDGGLHKMSIIANGKTVKLLLDGQLGAEVKFPFSRVIFEFGSYARDNGDTADTSWDNLKIETTVRQSTVVFQDDFAATTIDPAKYQPDAPFFEGGAGDIHAEAKDGTIEFVGSTTQQWWAGGTLRVVPTFEASEASVLTLSVDRVSEAGVGTASRSALWILDETRTKYVLFADVRAEGGWRYNRKIGEDGDVPTGSGTDIALFNGTTYDDGGLHRMSMIADGKTVKLLLDGVEGAEVKFPYSPVIFEFGSYARANGDTASTVWDNLVIETAGGATFSPNAATVRAGQNGGDIVVKIPAGLNAQSAVTINVVSADPNTAIPAGSNNGSLALTFPAGGSNVQSFKVKGVKLGTTLFSLEGDVPGGNQLAVAVVNGPGVLLQESFASATIDTTKWQVSNTPFEAGTGTFTVASTDGVLEVSGTTDTDYWPGAGIRSANGYIATPEVNLSVEVDRVSMETFATAARSGVFLTTADRSKFVFFGQDEGETGWEVNVNPGNPTGSGTAIPAFAGLATLDSHHIKMVADGSSVEIFLDGISGGKFPFAVTSGIFVEIGAYARSISDLVTGRFDNVTIEHVLPCIEFSTPGVSMTLAESGQLVEVSVPALLHDLDPLSVTVTSANPAVAVPAGGSGASLTLTFPAGGPSTQVVNVTPVGKGRTTFSISSSPASCVESTLAVDVVAVPLVLLTDDFTSSSIDSNKWVEDATPFDTLTPGGATVDSAISITNGQVKMNVIAEFSAWPGLALFTKNTYSATGTEPTTFEVDRVKLDYVLVTGTGAEERTGMWVKEPGGNFVFFNEYVAHDGDNFGWRYNKQTGEADDTATGAGINIASLDGPAYNDQGNHHMKVVANGSSVKLYLDGIFGAEVPFAYSQGLTFGFGSYVAAATDIVTGVFDNAKISGGEGEVPVNVRLTASLQQGNIVITWTGVGTLEEADAVQGTGWRAVTPAPTGNSYTVPPASQGQKRFYRVRK